MEQYTDGQLKQVIEKLNRATMNQDVIDWIRNAEEIVKTDGFEVPENIEDYSEDEQSEVFSEMIKIIKSKIPEDQLVYAMSELDFSQLYWFYDRESVNEHPKLFAITLKKIYELEVDYTVDWIYEEIFENTDLSFITQNFNEIANEFVSLNARNWEGLFVEKIWKSLDEQVKSEKFKDIIEMLKNNKTKERPLETEDKITKVVQSVSIQTLRENGEITFEYLKNAKRYEIRHKDKIGQMFSGLTEDKQHDLLEQLYKAFDTKDNEVGNNSIRILLDTIKYLSPAVLEKEFKNLLLIIDKNTKENNKVEIAENLKDYEKYMSEPRRLAQQKLYINKEFKFGNVNFEKTLRYVKNFLKADKYELVNDDYINHVYQAIKAGNLKEFGLDETQISELEEVFNEYVTAEPESNMDKYEQYVNNLSDMPEEEFEEFCENLIKLKYSKGILPEKYCDYLIKQKINPDSHLNKNKEKQMPILKRAFEDKSKYVLKDRGVDKEYIINVCRLPSGMGGVQNEKGMIQLSETELRRLDTYHTRIIGTMFHECKHAEQFSRMKNPQSSREYVIIKEDIIRRIDEDFYDKNYKMFFAEIDARIIGAKDEVKYLRQLGFLPKDIAKFHMHEVFESYKTEQLDEIKNLDTKSNSKLDMAGKIAPLNEIFISYLKNNLHLLQEYPALSIEFDENGDRKPRSEVLKMYEVALREAKGNKESDNRNTVRIYPAILKDGSGLKPSSLIKEIEELQDYIPGNAYMEKMVNEIITSGALQLFEQTKLQGRLSLLPEDTEEEQENNFNMLVSRLEAFSKKHPNQEISVKIMNEIKAFIVIEDKASQERAILENNDDSITPEQRNQGKAKIESYRKRKTKDELTQEL